jgi:cell division protein ZapA
MSETIKIKLTIANRVYPLSIPADQEFSLRESARKIDDTIQQLEKNYAVRDKQDVLAMCSLQFATQVENYKGNASTSRTYDDEKIKELTEMIEIHLDTY